MANLKMTCVFVVPSWRTQSLMEINAGPLRHERLARFSQWEHDFGDNWPTTSQKNSESLKNLPKTGSFAWKFICSVPFKFKLVVSSVVMTGTSTTWNGRWKICNIPNYNFSGTKRHLNLVGILLEKRHCFSPGVKSLNWDIGNCDTKVGNWSGCSFSLVVKIELLR